MGANKFQAAATGATAGYYEGIKSGLNYTKSIDNSDRADWKAYRIRYEAELKVQALRESGNYSITAENEIWSRACAAYAGLGDPEGSGKRHTQLGLIHGEFYSDISP